MPPTPHPPLPEPTRLYTCPACDFEITPMVEYMGLYALRWGGALATEFHGLCLNCGGAVHFQINTQLLQRLLKRSGVEVSEKDLSKTK